VDYKTNSGRSKVGLFSNYIKELVSSSYKDIEIPLFIESGGFPSIKIDNNLLLIATGTGIAPIRNILWERFSLAKSKDLKDTDIIGQTKLIFGCRHKDKDYLYGEEFELFKSSERMK
jgi:sulfite reductase alpha subunit-like flavoprotein